MKDHHSLTLFLVHCWNYRKWLADHFKVPALQELDYTGRKIFQNFSNYSGWHRRSQLMLQAFPSDAVKDIIIAGNHALQ